jgi:hypothetical protein
MIDVTPVFVSVSEPPRATFPPPESPVLVVIVIEELSSEAFGMLDRVLSDASIVLFVSV